MLSRFLRPLRYLDDADIIVGSRDVSATYLQAVGILGDSRLSFAAAARHRARRRDAPPGDVLAGPGPRSLERRIRAAVAPSRRRPLRRESEPPLQAPPVPGDSQACA